MPLGGPAVAARNDQSNRSKKKDENFHFHNRFKEFLHSNLKKSRNMWFGGYISRLVGVSANSIDMLGH